MNLPEAFIQRTKEILGDEYSFFEKALDSPAVVSVRVNNKMHYAPSADHVPWCADGYYLNERPVFTADPLFHCGVYYVQEASSMFLTQVVKQYFANADRVLDLCAAPGGKSTLLSQALPENALLVSNEIIRSRANILAENVIKWGNANVVVTNNKPGDFVGIGGYFDAIVVDAPCSGEGMFRKDPNAIGEWSEQNVKLCAERQKNIITDVWSSLKDDGILVYSTCTYNREENEENVKWICENLGAELLRVDLAGLNQITQTDCGYRFYPHKTRGEGFFISVLRKKDFTPDFKFSRKTGKNGIKQMPYNGILPFELLKTEDFTVYVEEDKVKACYTNRVDDYSFIANRLKVLHSGITLGNIKGKDFIPDISVALSKFLNLDSVSGCEIDYKTAIAYLKRENVVLPDANRGYVLLTYKNQPLGWVKNLGNRCNNLYPQEWRIRMNL
ncbi:rRNA cytosine-C5-methyltransferase [Paludibacter sp. 221]|uniref:methyltransferase RsmF C-terminal domain-like protein n=1 Tax=Paludibacter sp. 221 TaxID=2302939 RepID=UPI0013D73B64|nr:rRNA cytosine-C5-methyltransferase [Paludibacter sp. 221]NDV46209.1 rRNA cytosine-C5-methyltransferase [Paludibacter sp. 221]